MTVEAAQNDPGWLRRCSCPADERQTGSRHCRQVHPRRVRTFQGTQHGRVRQLKAGRFRGGKNESQCERLLDVAGGDRADRRDFCGGGPVPAARRRSAPNSVTVFQNVRIFDGKSERALRAFARAGARQQDRENLRTADPDRPAGRYGDHCRRWPDIDARFDRHALAHDAGAADARASADVGRRLRQPGGGRRGHGHFAARVHHRARPGRAVVRAQAGDRRRSHRRSANLSVRRRHHRHQRSRRLSPAVRSAAHPWRPADAHGTARRQHGGGQSG